MNDNTFWTLLTAVVAASLGLLLGVVLGDEMRRRRNAEAKAADLLKQLQQSCSMTPTLDRQLKEIRSVLNDVHKRIAAVSKGLVKPAP